MGLSPANQAPIFLPKLGSKSLAFKLQLNAWISTKMSIEHV